MPTTKEVQGGALLAAALDYAARGWQVIPIYGLKNGNQCECKRGRECSSPGKHPRLDAWQKQATTDEDQIAKWWGFWNWSNVGVRLGPESGIVDIEFDDEAGREVSERLLGGCFTPSFSSGRSIHRLFLWNDGLRDKAVHKVSGLEFRTGTESRGAQSVMPPSIHHTGKQYAWLPGLGPDDVDPIEIPADVLALILGGVGGSGRKAASGGGTERRDFLEAGVAAESTRNNTLHREACAKWRERVTLGGHEAVDDPIQQKLVWRDMQGLNLLTCRPPLSDDELHTLTESARKFISGQAAAEAKEAARNLTALGLEFREGDWWPGMWSVQIQDSDPPSVFLSAPFLAKPIELTVDDFSDAKEVHLAVWRATGNVCLADQPGRWEKIWNGTKDTKEKRGFVGLKAKLVTAAKKVAAPPETRQWAAVTRFVMLAASGAKQLGDGEKPRHTAVGYRVGSDVFLQFDELLKEASFQRLDLTRRELSNFFGSLKAERVKTTCFDGQRVNFFRLNESAMRMIQEGENPT